MFNLGPSQSGGGKIIQLVKIIRELALWVVLLESCLNENDSGPYVDDLGEDFQPQHTDYEAYSETEGPDQNESQNDMREFEDRVPLSSIRFFGEKKKYLWAKTAPNQIVRTLAHNIVLH